MAQTPIIFRFRYAIHTAIIALGFFAPWNYGLHLDHGKSVWEYLSIVLFQRGWLRFEAASVVLLLLSIFFGALAAALRTWGTAYLGASIVQSAGLHSGDTAGGVMADGPYRYLRNPLYLGTFLYAVAIALVMPPSGAIFSIVLIGVVQGLLIAAEEPFLAAKLGAPYAAYCARVPRLLPALPARVPPAGARPHWLQAALGELNFIGVPVSFALFGWSYNANLLLRCVIVSAGVWLVARAFQPAATVSAH